MWEHVELAKDGIKRHLSGVRRKVEKVYDIKWPYCMDTFKRLGSLNRHIYISRGCKKLRILYKKNHGATYCMPYVIQITGHLETRKCFPPCPKLPNSNFRLKSSLIISISRHRHYKTKLHNKVFTRNIFKRKTS